MSQDGEKMKFCFEMPQELQENNAVLKYVSYMYHREGKGTLASLSTTLDEPIVITNLYFTTFP